jgi:hypothetical protein
MFSSSVSGKTCLISLSNVMMLMHTDSSANGSCRKLATIVSSPTLTDSIGSPRIEPEVSINKYTGNRRIFLLFTS